MAILATIQAIFFIVISVVQVPTEPRSIRPPHSRYTGSVLSQTGFYTSAADGLFLECPDVGDQRFDFFVCKLVFVWIHFLLILFDDSFLDGLDGAIVLHFGPHLRI